MLRHLEQVGHAGEAGRARKLGGDVIEGDGGDGLDLDLPALHRIALPPPHGRPRPDPHAARDRAAAHRVPEESRELHRRWGYSPAWLIRSPTWISCTSSRLIIA